MMTMHWLLIFVVSVVGVRIVLKQLAAISRIKQTLGSSGEVVWIDEGKETPPFRHPRYRIIGKGDAIQVRDNGGFRLWEYKSRRRPVFHSDIQQARAAALASRAGGWDVREIAIKTALETKHFEVPHADADLYDLIRNDVQTVQAAKKRKKLAAKPNKAKCRTCAFVNACHDAHA